MGRPRAVLYARVSELEANKGFAGQELEDDLRRTVQAMRDCRPNVDTPAARKRAREALDILPPKWGEIFGHYIYHPTQAAARASTSRYRAIEAGRRSGKTADRKAEIVERALDQTGFDGTGCRSGSSPSVCRLNSRRATSTLTTSLP